MEFCAARLPVNLQRHHVDFGIVEFNPGQVVAIGAEVQSLSVGDDLFFVYPVTDTVENCTRYTCMPVANQEKKRLK